MQTIRQIVNLKGRDLQIHVPDAFPNQTVEVVVRSVRPGQAGRETGTTPTMTRLLRKPVPARNLKPLTRDECHARWSACLAGP
jgi:hypothetical protein